MSDEKTVTEREAVERERAAWLACDMEFATERNRAKLYDQSKRVAAERYPLPKVTRPRVVTVYDPELRADIDIRVTVGQLQWKRRDALVWQSFTRSLDAEKRMAKAVLDVAANPTEEVEDDT